MCVFIPLFSGPKHSCRKPKETSCASTAWGTFVETNMGNLSLSCRLSRSSWWSCIPRGSSVPSQMKTTWLQLLIAMLSMPSRLLHSPVVEAPHNTQVTMATGCPSKALQTVTSHTRLAIYLFFFISNFLFVSLPRSFWLTFIHTNSHLHL